MSAFRLSIPWLITLLAGMLTACASPPERTRKQAPLTIDIQVPETLGDFRFTEREAYEDIRTGEKRRFASATHPELTSDVFIFVPGAWPDHASAIDALAGSTVNDLEIAQQQGLFSDLELLSSSPYKVVTHYDEIPGRHLRMAFKRNGQEQISHAHLFYLPPYSIKFRSTFPAYGNTSFDDQIDSLVRSFMADLRIGKATRCRRELNWHFAARGEPAWVSLDGMDIVTPQGMADDAIAAILLLSVDRQAKNFCNLD